MNELKVILRETGKKMERMIIAVMILLTVTYAVALYHDIQRYEAWKQTFLQEHPGIEPWIDFTPYFGTNIWAVIGLLGLVASWSIALKHLITSSRRLRNPTAAGRSKPKLSRNKKCRCVKGLLSDGSFPSLTQSRRFRLLATAPQNTAFVAKP